MASSPRPPAFAAVPVILGAAVGGGLVLLATTLGGGGSELARADDPAAARQLERLADGLDEVSRQQAELVQRLRDVELALVAVPTSAPDPGEPVPLAADTTPELLESLRDDLARLTAAMNAGEAGGPLVGTVVEALEVVEQREREEREERRREFMEERAERQLEQLTEALGLDVYQQEKMKDLMADAGEKREALDDLGGSRDERRDARNALRDEVDASLAGFLTADQMQTMKDGDMSVFGGWGRGGPGGGRGRGR